VGRRDAEAENVPDVGEGGRAGAALAGGDGLHGAADEADDPAGRLSYLSCRNQTNNQRRMGEKATHYQQRKFNTQHNHRLAR